MTRILRINGSVADIDSNVKINLSFKSPIFGDLQKLSANTTLTIKLPHTAANNALIQNVNVVGVDGQFPYDYFRVDLEQDGLIIIDNGVGYLLAIGEQIEISVIFGGISNFAPIKEAKLNAMPVPVEQGQIVWDGAQFADIYTRADIMYLTMDYGMGIATSTDYAHPVVRVPKIINWINEAYGLNIAPIGQGLVVPCITKICRNEYRRPYTSTLILKKEHELNLGRTYLYPDVFNINTGIAGSFNLHNAHTVNSEAFYNDDALFSIEMVAARADKYGDSYVLTDVLPTRICVTIEGKQQWYEREVDSAKILEVAIPRGKKFQLICQVPAEGIFTQYVGLRLSLNIVDSELLTRGEKFDTLNNLPAIKVTEFIKAIMQIEGRFPQLTPAGIGWVSVDDLYNGIAAAVDWSDKLNKVVSHSFQIDSYAQDNTFRWTEDDTVKLVDEASLYVESKVLSEKRELVKLPFAASDNIDTSFGSFASVPIYLNEVANDGTETIEYNEVRPRVIAEVLGMRGIPCGAFLPRLQLSGAEGIVARCYSKYQDVIRRPRTVKCEMMLTTQDIASLDLMRPIYVEQLNGYFAILSATTKDNITDVELLKL